MEYLPVIDQDVLVFDINTVRRLREIGILGNFIGSLSSVPQQNNFLGLPLKLTKYEVYWLVEQNLAKLVSNTTLQRVDNKRDGFFVTEYTNTLTSTLQGPSHESSGEMIDSESAEDQSAQDLTESDIDNDHSQLIKRFDLAHDKSYAIFKQLRNNGYFILPGLKFGGEFIVYPGDPIRYHSHYIVNALSDINMLHLVVSGRLASGVKKLFVISEPEEQQEPGQEPEQQNLIFSIEWAGFG